jgi:hypothetical protein
LVAVASIIVTSSIFVTAQEPELYTDPPAIGPDGKSPDSPANIIIYLSSGLRLLIDGTDIPLPSGMTPEMIGSGLRDGPPQLAAIVGPQQTSETGFPDINKIGIPGNMGFKYVFGTSTAPVNGGHIIPSNVTNFGTPPIGQRYNPIPFGYKPPSPLDGVVTRKDRK